MANSKCQQTILVIEDGIANDGMLSLILATRGYKVVAAKNGQDAINKSRLPIDLIVLDLILPDMNGIEVCHYLKRAEVTRNVPVIILSERACGVDQKVQCFQLGADDFLCKPFDNEELLARIFALLRRHYGEESHAESERFEHLKQLKHIVDHELIEPNFQPIYLLDRDSSCQLYGMEVLSRPLIDGALKNPEMLFEVALELGFYYELEMMVWKKALGILNKNGPMPNIFFNCSPYLIENNKFPQVHKIFESFSVSPQNVFFELTERSAISKYALFCDRLQEFRDSGFKIAVDDVGSGYASLESIIETRPEVVKIDRHIIHGLTANSYKRSIVKFIVSFCCEHDIICVAEGVETAGEFALLKDLGVTAFQGYYFYKPTPLVDLDNFRKITVYGFFLDIRGMIYMHRHFEEELQMLKEKLLRMSSLVEESISLSIKSLVERDSVLAEKVVGQDDMIDEIEIEVDGLCLNLLALQQPQARDLRFITGSLKIVNDLERMGDLAVNIAHRSLDLLKVPLLKPLIDIPRMAQLAQAMLKDSLNAFVNDDVQLAREVCMRDDEVDKLNVQIFRELLTYMLQDPSSVQRAVDLILVAKNLERIADHSTNIAEDVIYIVEARVVKHHMEEA